MRKVKICSLLFPMCPTYNKAFPQGGCFPFAVQMEESCPGVATALCLPSRVVTEPAAPVGAHLWEHPRAAPVGAHTCGSIPGWLTCRLDAALAASRGWPCHSTAVSRKCICLLTWEVPDGDHDSPRDLLTSLPLTVTDCPSWHLVLFH